MGLSSQAHLIYAHSQTTMRSNQDGQTCEASRSS